MKNIGSGEKLLVLTFFDNFDLICKIGPKFVSSAFLHLKKRQIFFNPGIFFGKFFPILMFNIQSHATLGFGIHFQFSLYSASIFDERATIFVQKAIRFT